MSSRLLRSDYLAFGGVLFILAALLTLRIKEPLFGEAKYIAAQEAAVLKASWRPKILSYNFSTIRLIG